MIERHQYTLGDDTYLIETHEKGFGRAPEFYARVYRLSGGLAGIGGQVRVAVWNGNWPGRLKPTRELARSAGEYAALRDYDARHAAVVA
jgi:hypothetical protein